MDKAQMYIVKLSNRKLDITELTKEAGFTKEEQKIFMAGYQQALDYLCYLIGEEDKG